MVSAFYFVFSYKLIIITTTFILKQNISNSCIPSLNIITQTNKGEPVIQNKKAPSGKAYLEIAKRVLGEDIEITIPGREKGFWARLKGFFKKG